MAKGGKYKDVTPNLPRFQEESKYQDRVNDKKAELQKDGIIPTPQLVRQYIAARAEADRIKDELSAANLLIAAYTQLLAEAYDEEGVSSMKVVVGLKGATVRLQIEPYASVKDKDAFRQWCLDNDLGNSLQLPWPSTNSITKERLLGGLPEPDGVEAFQKPKLVLTRDK